MKPSRFSRVLSGRLFVFAALGAVALLTPRQALGFACLWDGSSSTNWATAANWSSCNGTTPQSSDTVTINSGGNQPSLSTSATVGQITLGTGATLTIASGGALTMNNGLTGGGNLTANSGGTLNWVGGTMDGAGTTTVSSGANFNVVGGASLVRTLSNAGTGAMSASGYMYIYTGGAFNNSGSFDLQNDQGIYPGNSGTIFTNTGTLKRSTSSGIANINTVFNNNGGTVQVQSGTLRLQGGGTLSGTFTCTGNTLQFTSGTFGVTTDFTGGTLVFSGGTINFNSGASFTSITQMTFEGATVNLNTGTAINPSNLTQTGGTLAGSDNITVGSGGTYTWQGGTLAGSGTTTIASGRNLILNGGDSLYRPLSNAGTATMSASGYMYVYTGGSFTNSGTLEIQNDQGFYQGNAGTILTNSGTINRTSSSGIAYITTVFNNSGTVNVQSGTLRIQNGGTLSGTFTCTGNTLQFIGGTFAVTSHFTGGTMLFSGGTINFNSGATFTSIAQMTFEGATVNFNTGTAISPSNITQTGGTVAGSDNITVGAAGTYTWQGGTLAGSGTLTIASGKNLLITGGDSLYRPLSNAGTATMSASGYMYIYTGGSFTNSGTLEIQNDQGFYQGNAGTILTNSGTINRTSSSGIAYITTVFNNSGAVNVQSGTLQLQGGGTLSGTFTCTGNTLQFNGGTWATTSDFTGGTLLFNGGTLNFNSGASFTSVTQMTFQGATVNFNTGTTINPGNLTQTGGTVSGGDNITVGAAGTYTWQGGTLSGTGTTTIASGRTLNITGGTSLYRPLSNAGAGTMSGSAYMYLYTGGSFTNSGTFDIQNDGGFYQGNVGMIVSNSGTVTRSTSSGIAYVQTVFNNTGTVNVQSGTFSVSHMTQTAGATHLSGGTLACPFGDSINIQGGILDGNGNIDGNVSVSASGQFNPGTSPGEIAILNNHTYTQATPGVLNIDINGTTGGVDFDRVLISGAATLGGELKVSLGYAPTLGDSFTILTHASRSGTFSKLTFPSPGAGLGWDLGYSATSTTLTIANLLAGSPMRVDAHAGTGSSSDVNGVLEPGERVVVEPSWQNVTESDITSAGTASNFTGPGGATYTLPDTSSDYGTIPADTTKDCFSATGNCFQVQVSDPATRPATHWDTTVKETVTGGTNKTWTLHVGDSFTDVPRSQPFYQKIETLLHNAITAGCTLKQYCPGDAVPRSQMAIFIAKGIAGGGANVPASGSANGQAYNCVSGGTSIFADVLPTDIFCKHVHYIAAQNVTLGCSATQYCPAGNVTRIEMAAFIAKAIVAPNGGAGVPISYGPDPVTGFSYNCNFGGNIHFSDVPAGSTFCKHVHYLWARGIIAGCSPTQYCPSQLVTRDAMAKFLSNAFNLQLYGPVP